MHAIIVKVLRRGSLIVAVLLVGFVVGGQMGLFAGRRPADLGVHDGLLKAPPATPNCVSSQSAGGYSEIAPLAYAGDAKVAWARLQSIVAAMPAATIVEFRADYLYAEFSSKWLGFVDDVEFHLDRQAAVVQVRSASRLGRQDFGVNRQRVEAIRQAFGNAPP